MYTECDKIMKELKKFQKAFDGAMEVHIGGETMSDEVVINLKSNVEEYEAKAKTIRTKLQAMDKFIVSTS